MPFATISIPIICIGLKTHWKRAPKSLSACRSLEFDWLKCGYKYIIMISILNLSGDDSDAFADDEAPSSDGGYEERDDISLVSTVSSVRADFEFIV